MKDLEKLFETIFDNMIKDATRKDCEELEELKDEERKALLESIETSNF